MLNISSCFEKTKYNKLFYLYYVPVILLLFLMLFMLLGSPDTSAQGMKNGIYMCIDTLVPSLFPSMLLFNCLFESGILNSLSDVSDKIMQLIFRLPGTALPIIIMSMIGGFPVGALLISRAYEKGKLTLNQSQRMFLFCVNPGPAFVVSTVGCFMLNSEKAGLMIYASMVISSMLIAFLLRFMDDGTIINLIKINSESKNHQTLIFTAVENSVKAMLNICVWVSLFSCFNSLIDILPLNKNLIVIIKMVTEVTNGTNIACEYFSLPVISSVMSFSGICVHLQIAAYMISVKLKYRYFLLSRIIVSAFSYVITFLITKICVEYDYVFHFGSKPVKATTDASVCVSAVLLFMCALYILGDNYSVYIKQKNKLKK